MYIPSTYTIYICISSIHTHHTSRCVLQHDRNACGLPPTKNSEHTHKKRPKNAFPTHTKNAHNAKTRTIRKRVFSYHLGWRPSPIETKKQEKEETMTSPLPPLKLLAKTHFSDQSPRSGLLARCNALSSTARRVMWSLVAMHRSIACIED